MVCKGLEKRKVEDIWYISLLLKLHDAKHWLHQDTHRNRLVLRENIGERTQHEFPYIIIMNIFYESKCQQLVYYRSLVISTSCKLV